MNLEIFFEKFDLFAGSPNAVARMRELVLALAVQGKLVEQDASDEPAKKLIARIMEQRQLDAQEERARTPQLLQPISPSEVPYELPSGWVWERLGNLGFTNIGLTYSPQNIGPTGVPVLRSSNIQNGRIDLSDLIRVAVDPKRSVLVEVGDLLICARNGSRALVGKTALIEQLTEPTAFGAFMAIFRSSLNKYLYHFICSPLFRRVIAEVNTTTINQITQGNLRSTLAPIPPLAEQKRIVAKVDELMALCDRLEAQQQERETRHAVLARASLACFADAPTPANLDFIFHKSYDIAPADLRKSILTLAVQGKLVPQDTNDEPSDRILFRLRARAEHERPTTRLQFEAIDAPYELPVSWKWIRLSELFPKFQNGASSRGDKNGIPAVVLRLADVSRRRLSLHETRTIPIDPKTSKAIPSGRVIR
jgi:type I restriction enzyme, S subunit